MRRERYQRRRGDRKGQTGDQDDVHKLELSLKAEIHKLELSLKAEIQSVRTQLNHCKMDVGVGHCRRR